MIEDKLDINVVPTPNTPHCGEPLSLAFTVDYTGDIAPLHVTELNFIIESGTNPHALCNGFTDVVLSAPDEWILHPSKDGSFTVKPKPNTKGVIKDKGLEFGISNLIVNDAPGQTSIKMVQIVGPDKTRYAHTHEFTKIYPPVRISDLKAVPNQSIAYDSTATISWAASVGSVLTLEYDGKEIRHAKGHPKSPLGHNASYETDERFVQQTVFTLTASASPDAILKDSVSKQTVVPIAPPSIEFSGKSTQKDPHPPMAELTWDVQSALTVELSSPLSGVIKKDLPVKGTLNVPFFMATDFTLSAQNPAFPKTIEQTVSLSPPEFGWSFVTNKPYRKVGDSQVYETHLGLALATCGRLVDDPVLMISRDGTDWRTVHSLPKMSMDNGPSLFVHNGEMTFMLGVTGVNPVPKMWSTKDFVKWHELQTPYKGMKANNCAMTFDDAGNVWAFVALSREGDLGPLFPKTVTVWKSSDQMQSWDQMDTGDMPPLKFPNLSYRDGKLWCIASDQRKGKHIYVATSEDGIEWKELGDPPGVEGSPTITSTVLKDYIYLFLSAHPLDARGSKPFMIWRLDKDGRWEKVSGQRMFSFNLNTGNLISIAQLNGTLFTLAQSGEMNQAGIWARNT